MSEKVPPPPDDAVSSPPWALDNKAKNEEANWSDEEKLRGQRHKNDILWLWVYGKIIVFVAILLTALFVASLTVWCLHYLIPAKLYWLDADQLAKIQSILFSGGLGAVVSGVAQRHLLK